MLMEVDKPMDGLHAQFQEAMATLNNRFTQVTGLVRTMSLKPGTPEMQRFAHHLQGAETRLKNAGAALQTGNLALVHTELRSVDVELKELEYLVQAVSREKEQRTNCGAKQKRHHSTAGEERQ